MDIFEHIIITWRDLNTIDKIILLFISVGILIFIAYLINIILKFIIKISSNKEILKFFKLLFQLGKLELVKIIGIIDLIIVVFLIFITINSFIGGKFETLLEDNGRTPLSIKIFLMLITILIWFISFFLLYKCYKDEIFNKK